VHLSLIQWLSVVLAVGSAAVQASILTIVIKKKRTSACPIFVTYTGFGVLLVVIGLSGYFLGSCQQYFYVAWVLGFLYVALEFALMYEIFVNALKPYSALIDLGKMLFAWATAFLLIAATLTAFATTGSQASKLTAAMALIERTMRLIQCGLLFLFFLFEKRLNLSWRSTNVAIALGLSVSAALDLSVSYLRDHIPTRAVEFGVVNSLAYLGVLVFWTYCVAMQKKERSSVLESPNRLIFQRWNEALISYQHGGDLAFAPSESFLPSVERTVERVMARKITN
jgi:hypothetical protein